MGRRGHEERELLSRAIYDAEKDIFSWEEDFTALEIMIKRVFGMIRGKYPREEEPNQRINDPNTIHYSRAEIREKSKAEGLDVFLAQVKPYDPRYNSLEEELRELLNPRTQHIPNVWSGMDMVESRLKTLKYSIRKASDLIGRQQINLEMNYTKD